MELVGVRVELPTNTPIALLRESEGERRLLPIFIGGPEATAIAFAIEGVNPPRPMTHDLIKNVLDDLGVRIDRVVVTELRDSTFYAEIEITAQGDRHKVSSRPSDAIALAVRAGTPIFAAETVLDEAAYAPSDEEPEQQEEVVEQFREFIDSVNPEDFAS
ncbi:bifunctional nuclease family protein [soil metagenome]